MTIQQAAQATLDRLREKGWSSHGPYGEQGEECIDVAALKAVPNRNELLRLRQAIMECMPSWFRRSVWAQYNITAWNDSADTHWEDVQRVLTEIAES